MPNTTHLGSVDRQLRAFRLGATVALAVAAAAGPALAAPDSLLHSFSGLSGEGITPVAPVVLGSDGFLYGTTQNAGAYSAGTVFKVRTDGTGFSVLHGFPSSFPEGYAPPAAVVLDGSGNMYGTTQFGGASNIGTVFTLRTDGSGFATVYSFSGGPSDGSTPLSDLVLDGSGYLYGTTQLGGLYGSGIVFKVKTNGTGLAILHSFAGMPDGDGPPAGVVMDSSGWLYGTTSQGGTYGWGTVFKVKSDGTGYATLYSFTGGTTDGGLPAAGLALAHGSVLYGTTELTGAYGSGTVFSIGTDGNGFRDLFDFGATFTDGSNPMAAVTLAGADEVFGTTIAGGDFGVGTVFKVRTDGSGYAIVHSFAGGTADGSLPYAAVTVDSSGNVYGTTTSGGAFGSGLGTVFEIARAAPTAVPVLGGAGRVALIAGLAAAAALALRRRAS